MVSKLVSDSIITSKSSTSTYREYKKKFTNMFVKISYVDNTQAYTSII